MHCLPLPLPLPPPPLHTHKDSAVITKCSIKFKNKCVVFGMPNAKRMHDDNCLCQCGGGRAINMLSI